MPHIWGDAHNRQDLEARAKLAAALATIFAALAGAGFAGLLPNLVAVIAACLALSALIAALVFNVVKVRNARAEAANAEGEHERAALGRRATAGAADQVDPTTLGVSAAAQDILPGGEVPEYVARAVDGELRTALEAGLDGSGRWLILVIGPSKVGKSRALFEAVQHCAQGRRLDLVAPVDGGALRTIAASAHRAEAAPTVLWLDDLEPFLEDGVTFATLREWQGGVPGRVVAATYGGKASERLVGLTGGSLTTTAAEVLQSAHQITMGATTTDELRALRAQVSADQFASLERHGLGAYLVAAPALERKLVTSRHAPGDPECPEGVAVVFAAVDWVLCGRTDPISHGTLRELWPAYQAPASVATNDAFDDALAWALRPVAGTIALMHRAGSYRAFDYVVRLVRERPDAGAPRDAAWAAALNDATGAQALAVATAAYDQDRVGDAICALNSARESSIDEIASIASLILGVVFGELDRSEDAVAVYDDIVARFGDAAEPALREKVVRALLNKGVRLGALGRFDDELAVYDEIVARFGDAPEPALHEQVAGALFNKGVSLGALGRIDEAVALYDDIVARFGDRAEPALREQVARALVNQGAMLEVQGRHDEAVRAYDQIIARYDGAVLSEQVATALVKKGVSLSALGRSEEAVALYDEVLARFGDAPGPVLREQVGSALVNKGDMLLALDRSQDALGAYDEIIARYGGATEPVLREHVATALVNKGIALGELTSAEDLRARDPESIERANVALAQWLEEDFQRNQREPVRVTALRLTDVDFFADTSWKLHESVNVVLGRNGYGKSLLLHTLAGMLQRDIDATADLLRGSGQKGRLELELMRSGGVVKLERGDTVFLSSSVGKVPLLAIPDERFTDRSTTTISHPDALNLATDGAYHFLARKPYGSAVDGLLNGLAIDYWEGGKTFALPTFSLIADVVTRLTGQPFEFRRIERIGRIGAEIWVRTEGLNRDLEIQRASQGTLSVITMFGLVHEFLQELAAARGADGTKDAREQAAIVLIDEVDAHLHPMWQQKIRNLLTDTFPNVQFVLSAHSPLIVAGCGPGEVSVMRRWEGRFGIQQLRKDFVGASSRELYAEIFEIEDQDEVFLQYANREGRGEIEELDKLTAKSRESGLSSDENLRREQLMRDVQMLSKVREIQAERISNEEYVLELEAEIARLGGDVRRHFTEPDA